jgi:hypothetical protein
MQLPFETNKIIFDYLKKPLLQWLVTMVRREGVKREVCTNLRRQPFFFNPKAFLNTN